MAPVPPRTLRAERGDYAMSNKQKNKSFESRQGQNQQPQSGKSQEIPTYGNKNQNLKPEMDGKNCHHNNGR